MSLAEEFFKTFRGLNRAYGLSAVLKNYASSGKVETFNKTVSKPYTVDQWTGHLSGQIGFGVIPIQDDNTCWWGAIDVDSYTLDLVELSKRVADLPLVVCRSKSGGAHIYLFLTEAVPAQDLRNALNRVALSLGFMKVEIFPKQGVLAGPDAVGNWINMPYFHSVGAVTSRYAIVNGETIESPERFLEIVAKKRIAFSNLLAIDFPVKGDFSDGPPCLQHFSANGIAPGGRNNVLYSMGIYLKQKYGDLWEEHLARVNELYASPKLSDRELSSIINSINKKSAWYRCGEQPLCSVCNKDACRMQKYGIGNSDDMGLVIGDFQVINTDEPVFIVNVNGTDIYCRAEDLLVQTHFRMVIFKKLRILPKKVKDIYWEQIITEKSKNAQTIDPPYESTPEGKLMYSLRRYLKYAGRGTWEDLLKGKPFWDSGYVYIRGPEFMRYLALQERNFEFKDREIWSIMQRDTVGATHGESVILGEHIRWWKIPITAIQDKDFSELDIQSKEDY